MDAVATIASDKHPQPGQFALLRETVIVDIGDRHVPGLDTIVDPLVVTDLPTVGGRRTATPMPSTAARPGPGRPAGLGRRARRPRQRSSARGELLDRVYVVDLAWLRTTPWRERVAATFDPAHLRPDLATISAVEVRHHPDSNAAALLLVGWLASRLGWQPSPLIARNGALVGKAHARRQDVDLRLEPEPRQSVRGLAGLTLETASGRHFSLDRGPGGLHARYRNRKGDEREWTVLGASRGEAGILGEGIRQALLRDGTYRPALDVASALVR